MDAAHQAVQEEVVSHAGDVELPRVAKVAADL